MVRVKSSNWSSNGINGSLVSSLVGSDPRHTLGLRFSRDFLQWSTFHLHSPSYSSISAPESIFPANLGVDPLNILLNIKALPIAQTWLSLAMGFFIGRRILDGQGNSYSASTRSTLAKPELLGKRGTSNRSPYLFAERKNKSGSWLDSLSNVCSNPLDLSFWSGICFFMLSPRSLLRASRVEQREKKHVGLSFCLPYLINGRRHPQNLSIGIYQDVRFVSDLIIAVSTGRKRKPYC